MAYNWLNVLYLIGELAMPNFISAALYCLMIFLGICSVILISIYVLLVVIACLLYGAFWFRPKLFIRIHRPEDRDALTNLMQAQRLVSDCTELVQMQGQDDLSKAFADRDSERLQEATNIRDKILEECQEKFNPATIRLAKKLSQSYFF